MLVFNFKIELWWWWCEDDKFDDDDDDENDDDDDENKMYDEIDTIKVEYEFNKLPVA